MLGNCRRFLSISMHIGEGLLGPLFSRPQCGSQETIHPFLPTPSLRPYTCRSQSTSESTVLFSAVTIAVSMTVTPFHDLKLVWTLHLRRHTVLPGWCSLSTHTICPQRTFRRAASGLPQTGSLRTASHQDTINLPSLRGP